MQFKLGVLFSAVAFVMTSAFASVPVYHAHYDVAPGLITAGRPIVTDVNGDGLPDVIVGSQWATDPQILLYLANRTNRYRQLSYQVSFMGGIGSLGPDMALADVNNDAVPEVLVHRENRIYYLTRPADIRQEWPATSLLFLSDVIGFRVLQYDGTGRLEILVLRANEMRIYRFTTASPPTLTLHATFGSLPTGYGVAIMDMNGDGFDEIIVRQDSETRAISFNPADTARSISRTLTGIGNFVQIVPADMDGDGRTDFVGRDGSLTIYRNTGDDTTFEAIPTGIQAVEFAVGDLDLDGVSDISSLEPQTGGAMILHAHHVRSLQPFTADTVAISPAEVYGSPRVHMADMDADGDLEVLWSYNLGWFPNNRATLAYVDTAPKVGIVTGWVADDDGDAMWLATEEARLVFYLHNRSDESVPVTVNIEPPAGVTMEETTLVIPPLAPSDTWYEFSAPFQIEPEAGCGFIGDFEISFEEGIRSEGVFVSTPPLGEYARRTATAEDKASFIIPDAWPAGVTRTLALNTATGIVSDFELTLDIRHTVPSQISFTLRAPDGTLATPVLKSVQKNLAAVYTVSNYRNRAWNGDFTLHVVDNTLGQSGTLAYWSITADYGDYECRDPEIAQSLWMILDLRAGTGQQGDLNRDGVLDSADMVFRALGEE